MLEMGRRSGGWFERLSRRLSSVPPDKTWVYFADAPEPDELARMAANNAALYHAWERIYCEPPYVANRQVDCVPKARMLWHSADEATGDQRCDLLAAYVRLCPDDHRGWAKLAMSYHAAGRPHDAITAARKANELQPQWYFPSFIRALSEFEAGQNREAIETCQHLLAQAPLDLSIMRIRQRAFEALGESATSLASLREICALHEADIRLKFKLGMSCAKLGLLQEAEAHFARIVEFERGHHAALNNYGYLLALRGEYRLALVACTIACKINRCVSYLDSLGLIHMELGQYDRATELLTEALKIDPGHAEALKHFEQLTARKEKSSACEVHKECK